MFCLKYISKAVTSREWNLDFATDVFGAIGIRKNNKVISDKLKIDTQNIHLKM